MASVQPTYAARVDEIVKQMKARGISRNKLVESAPTTHATLRSILDDGNRAILDTYRKIAKALAVTDVSTLYIDDNPMPDSVPKDMAPQGIPLDIELDEDATAFDETTVNKIVAAIIDKVGATKSVFVINIILNSVTLRLSFAEEDIPRLFIAFADGKLDHLKVKAIAIPRDIANTFAQLFLDPESEIDSILSEDFAPAQEAQNWRPHRRRRK